MYATPGQSRPCAMLLATGGPCKPLLVERGYVRHSWSEAGELSDQSIEISIRINRERKI